MRRVQVTERSLVPITSCLHAQPQHISRRVRYVQVCTCTFCPLGQATRSQTAGMGAYPSTRNVFSVFCTWPQMAGPPPSSAGMQVGTSLLIVLVLLWNGGRVVCEAG
jgi:hypothetical protein